jgi:NTE family protein
MLPANGKCPRVALALGAGGARGLAHIGVIEELLRRGYPIVAIAGSSMGALVGGIHAAGRLPVYRDWVTRLARMDVLRLVDWTLSGGGLIKGERIIGALRDLVGEVAIERLPLDYTAVAVDLDRQREIWFSSGALFDAIRASIAIPSLFRPHVIDGRRLVDGGLMNPLPVTPLLRTRYDVLVAVGVNGPRQAPEHPAGATPPTTAAPAGFLHLRRRAPAAEAEHAPGTLELLAQSFDLMQNNLAKLRLATQPPDVLIEVPRDAAGIHEFYRAAELIEAGRRQAMQALDAWETASSQR